MAETVLQHTATNEEATTMSQINDTFAEIKRVRSEMEQARERISHSKKRSSLLASETKEIIARIQAHLC